MTLDSSAGAAGLTTRTAGRSSLTQAQGDTLARWRVWVTGHPIASSLLAGAVATQIATVFGIWFRGFGLPTLSWPAVNGAIILPTGTPVAQFAVGELVHTVDGVIFALLFALLVHPRIGGCLMSPSRALGPGCSAPASAGSWYSASSCGI